MVGRSENKVALVTGASRGIGAAVAQRLADDGALVIVHFSRAADSFAGQHDAAEHVLAKIASRGGTAFAVEAELGVPGDVTSVLDGVRLGLRERRVADRLDILVNNAGVFARTPTAKVTPELFDHVMAVNARAPFFLVRQAIELLRGGGRVVNISSGLTRTAEPGDEPEELVGAMSKAALEMLTLHLAPALGRRGITINTVAPGVVDTGDPALRVPEVATALARLSPFGRLGEPADIADIVAFLASPDGRWTTGSWVDATGGALVAR
jgi:NAD(P)-dependent dehydrogenase (short-subunit alcohol dehydrogenase family)